MSGPWHEVLVRGRYRIVALDADANADSPARHAVMTRDGAWLRRDLSLSEARTWLDHFDDQDARALSPASAPPGTPRPHPRRRAR